MAKILEKKRLRNYRASKQKALNKKLYDEKEWYTIRSLLGNQ
jgi:hypothetical protein